MKARLIAIVMLTAVAALAGASAQAACDPTKFFGNSFGPSGFNGYWILPAGADNTNAGILGHWWQSDNRASHQEGAGCPDDVWLLDFGGPGRQIYGYMGGDAGFGACDNTGCPVAQMTVVLQTPALDGSTAYLTVARANEEVVGYDFGREGQNWNALPIPRPVAQSSSRSGTNVVLDLRLPNSNALFHSPSADGHLPQGTIIQYRLLEAVATSDPGRNPAAWPGTPKSTHTYTGADLVLPGVSVDCSNTALDRFLAIQPVIEAGATDFNTEFVSQSLRVECDPALADPGKFKLIDKKPRKGDQ